MLIQNLQHSVNSSHNTDNTNTFPGAPDTESAHLQHSVNSSHNTDNTNTFPGAPDTESAHHAHLEPATLCEQFTQPL